MATPKKTNTAAVVPDVSLCVACSKDSKQRYYIKGKNGSEGPCYKLAENFYHVSFNYEGNNGSFLCIGCKRLLQRILDMEEQTQKLVQKVNLKSQKMSVRVSQKRLIELTPNNRNKRASLTYSPELKGNQATGPKVINQKQVQCKLNFHHVDSCGDFNMDESFQEYFPLTSDKEVQCVLPTPSPPKTLSSRKEQQLYKSLDIKRRLSPIVRSLQVGSVRKATKLLLSSNDISTRDESIKGVCDVVKKTSKQMLQSKRHVFQKQSEEDLFQFDIQQLVHLFQCFTPLLWSVMKTVAVSNANVFNSVKVVSALFVLLNSRSKHLNKLQHLVGISMYNCQLQKEGFEVLSKIGLSVSHSCVHRTLSKAQSTVDREMMQLKASVEDNKKLEHLIENEDRQIRLSTFLVK